ncbi:hypothetical protein ES708_30891 [subsurface metagenome]
MRFAYTIFHETIEKSKIKSDVLSIPEEIVKQEIIDFINLLPEEYAINFLRLKTDILVNLSIINAELKEDLKVVIKSLIEFMTGAAILNKSKENIIELINNCQIESNKIILRNYLDILVENQDLMKNDEKIHLIKYLLCYQITNESKLKEYFNFWKDSNKKVIFGDL